jgi:hypothetical protein
MQGTDEVEQKSSTVANDEESKCVYWKLPLLILFLLLYDMMSGFRYVAAAAL